MPTVNYTANNIYTITADLKKSYENASSNGYLDLITNNPSKAYNYPNIYCNYVQWDCPTLGENYFISHEKGDNYNAITTPTNLVTDLVNVAGASCKNCPSYNEGSWYLKAGAYIDKNKKWGEGTNQIGGIWLKKKAAIVKSGLVSDENFGKTYSGTNSIKSVPSLPNGFDTTDWFFLPAAGYVNNHTTYNVGEYALYFLKTASTDGKFYTTGFQFLLDNASIDMENALRSWGAGLWDVQ
jgi:hypothetical protein